MCKRVIVILGLLGIIAAIGICVAALPPRPGDRINQQTFDEIRVGMTLHEVETLIGVPVGSYATVDVWYCRHVSSLSQPGPYFGCREISPEWAGNDGRIELEMDEDGTVKAKHFSAAWPNAADTVIQRFRRWLRL